MVKFFVLRFIILLFQIFTDFKEAYDLGKMEVIYNILIVFGIHMNLVSLIKSCLFETSSKFWVGKYLSDLYPIRNDLKNGNVLSPFPFQLCCRVRYWQDSV